MLQGVITTSHGRHFSVEHNGKLYHSTTKGKNTELVVGDNVVINLINNEQAQIIELLPRNNLVYRSDNYRSKIIASNITQLIIVVAVKPNFNSSFLDSCLIFAESSAITPLIIINKMDLAESANFAKHLNELYALKLDYQILELSALTNCDNLSIILEKQKSLLIGQSGVGKSTILNQICPEAYARTSEITKSAASGRHTTTHANLYHINAKSDLIDCPGLQEFGLAHLAIDQVVSYFPEMREQLGKCKFYNCLHLNEPQCKIKDLVSNQQIDLSRYNFYCRLINTLKAKQSY